MSGGDGATECAAGNSGQRADDHHDPEAHGADRYEQAADSSGGRAREQSLANSPRSQFSRVRYARQQPCGCTVLPPDAKYRSTIQVGLSVS
jgi:hypothetical protein